MSQQLKPKVMIVGFGSVGAALLNLLASDGPFEEIVVASRNEKRATEHMNLARVSAFALGHTPRISFERCDLYDAGAAADVLSRHSPDLLVCTASMQTWWLPELLPASAQAPLSKARFGAWLPVHLTLSMAFMQAVRRAGYRGHTLIASFPDVVNVVLSRIGLQPTAGIGNLDEIVPKVRHLAGERLRVSPRALRVLLVAHHSLEPFVFGSPNRERPPFWIRIEHEGRDVTTDCDVEGMLFAPYPLPSGPAWHVLTAASAVGLIRALSVPGSGGLTHVPGPQGLPGGYPVIASPEGITLVDLPGISRAEAIAINEASHRYDGIESISEDGMVTFEQESVAAMHEALGYDVRQLKPADSRAAAEELMAKFREYAARNGVRLP